MSSIYKNLLHDHFRLLVKVPGTQDRDLRFRFIDFVPSLAPSYTAVSYAWGRDQATETIYVDNKPIEIRPNLWACLHILRREWTYIWADAVCINQEDTAEKNQQVRLMEQIYAKAAVVSVWLGLVPLPTGMTVTGRVVTLEVDEFDWRDALPDLASRPYWSRTWVIQEFLLARRIHLYCSNTRIDDLFFQELLSDQSGLNLLRVMETTDLVTRSDLMKKWPALALMFQRNVDRYPSLSQSLYSLLLTYTYTESTDPRDRVFALLGLLNPMERGALQRCFPDYGLREDTVKAVTLAHLRVFAFGMPFEPVYEALRIRTDKEISWLRQASQACAYTLAHNPAIEVEHWIRSREAEELAFRTYGTFSRNEAAEIEALTQLLLSRSNHQPWRLKLRTKLILVVAVLGFCICTSLWIRAQGFSGI